MKLKKGKKKVVTSGVKVNAVTAGRGPPATTVNVEVERRRLNEEARAGKVKRVVAELPEEIGQSVRWKEAPLERLGMSPKQGAPEPEVEKFSGTYGSSTPRKYGVGVKLETESGTVRAQSPGEAYTVHEADKPTPSGKVRRPRKRRR